MTHELRAILKFFKGWKIKKKYRELGLSLSGLIIEPCSSLWKTLGLILGAIRKSFIRYGHIHLFYVLLMTSLTFNNRAEHFGRQCIQQTLKSLTLSPLQKKDLTFFAVISTGVVSCYNLLKLKFWLLDNHWILVWSQIDLYAFDIKNLWSCISSYLGDMGISIITRKLYSYCLP